jgi:hypothetical protein
MRLRIRRIIKRVMHQSLMHCIWCLILHFCWGWCGGLHMWDCTKRKEKQMHELSPERNETRNNMNKTIMQSIAKVWAMRVRHNGREAMQDLTSHISRNKTANHDRSGYPNKELQANGFESLTPGEGSTHPHIENGEQERITVGPSSSWNIREGKQSPTSIAKW